MKIKISLIASLFAIAFFGMSFNCAMIEPSNEPWVVPEKYQKLQNPVKADKESIATGKELYTIHCKSCHGKEGLGDGPKAAQLDTHSGDFTAKEFKAQPDGSIFYKTAEGRDDMPGFRKKIPDDEEMWSIINYVRTLE